MVVYSATQAPRTKQDGLYALWSLLQEAREEPFNAPEPTAWRLAMSEFALRIDAMLRRNGAPFSLTTASDALIRDMEEVEFPTILDVIRVCERLIQMEMLIARMRNQASDVREAV
ncbi:MAG: hypothetical protein ABIP13_03455 [Tepidiformaceae bacterium]